MRGWANIESTSAGLRFGCAFPMIINLARTWDDDWCILAYLKCEIGQEDDYGRDYQIADPRVKGS